MKRYAVADEVPDDCDYLTAGKEYEALWFFKDPDGEHCFTFINDKDVWDFAYVEKTAHLDGKSWRIVERES